MNVSQEIAALHHIGAAKDFNGERMAFAFGYCFDTTANDAPEWLFEISQDGNEIVAVIDVYGAIHVAPGEFDADEWESRKIRLCTPARRAGYQALQSAARAILKGYRVSLPDGTLVHVKDLAQ